MIGAVILSTKGKAEEILTVDVSVRRLLNLLLLLVADVGWVNSFRLVASYDLKELGIVAGNVTAVSEDLSRRDNVRVGTSGGFLLQTEYVLTATVAT